MKYYASTEFKMVYLNRLIVVDGDEGGGAVYVCDPNIKSIAPIGNNAESWEVIRRLYVEITAEDFISRFLFLRATNPTPQP